MRVYLLWWDNGLDYSDHSVELLGIYSTPEKRAAAQKEYEATQDCPRPAFYLSNYGGIDGCFEGVEMDVDASTPRRPIDSKLDYKYRPSRIED